jgi:hypothetical protein
MMKFVVLTFLLTVSTAFAQEISKTVIGASGEPIFGSAISINFTLGEPVVGAVNKTNSLEQGFWSGGLEVIDLNTSLSLEGLVVYPNPVDIHVNISTGGLPVFGMMLYAMDHSKIVEKTLPKEQTLHQINLEQLSKGVYILQVYVEGADVQLFKVIKK